MSRTIEVLRRGRIEKMKLIPVENLRLNYKDMRKAFSMLLGISEEYIEEDVKDFFSNGHIARGILSYILCSSLNNKAGHPKWSVEQGGGTSLFLSYYTGILTCSKYEFHTIDEEYNEEVRLKDYNDEEEIKGYFFADIARIRNFEQGVFFHNL